MFSLIFSMLVACSETPAVAPVATETQPEVLVVTPIPSTEECVDATPDDGVDQCLPTTVPTVVVPVTAPAVSHGATLP